MADRIEPPPCRLSVILARKAPVGVIFRRGPSKLVELIRWNTENDTFERGQWFKGRIYEHRSDLSPDGSLLIYFAAKFMGRWAPEDADSFPDWTAISKPPWLTALALWPARRIWPQGGGLFEDEKTVWLNHLPDSATPQKGHIPHGLWVVLHVQPDSLDGLVFPQRLARDGWILEDEGWMARHAQRRGSDWPPAVWVKAGPDNRWALAMNGHLMLKWATYCLVDSTGGAELPIENADWADWDQQGRLVFARNGKQFAGEFDGEGGLAERELADFNADMFEARQAPAWAREW